MSGINPNLRNFDPLFSASTQATLSANQPTQLQGSPPPMNAEQVQYLKNQGFSMGMIRAFHSQKESFPLRVWILDNSSAMNVRDAHIVRGNQLQSINNVTRWEELKDCLLFHTELTARFLLPTRFSLVNAPQQGLPQYFSLAQSGNLIEEQQTLHNVLTYVLPNGPTPITPQLQLLHAYISSIASQLNARQYVVPIVITTQGLPTNANGETSSVVINEFFQMLQSFECLPVSIALRLCTDDDKAIDFYNSVDKRLKLDVLDDFYGEALEAYLRNPWLTYGIALHRYREMGFRVRALDILDERALTKPELHEFCNFLFDVYLPDPLLDWNNFIATIRECLSREQMQWNPIKKAFTPWIDIGLLMDTYCLKPNAPSYHGQTFNQSSFRTFTAPDTPNDPQTPAAAPTLIHPNSTKEALPNQLIADSSALVAAVESKWAKYPPPSNTKKPIADLLCSIDSTFHLVPNHEYFSAKFQPFSTAALSSGSNDVLKRAVRKMRFFLHPDRLPKDFNEQQTLLCRTLWDVISESWDSLESK